MDDYEVIMEKLKVSKAEEKKIKKDFETMKKMLLAEKLKEIDQRIERVKSLTDEEVKKMLDKLNEEKEIEFKRVSELNTLKLTSLIHKIEAEKQSIIQSTENDKEMERYYMQVDLENQLQQLNDEHNKIKLNTLLWHRQHESENKVQIKSKPKLVSVDKPHIVYMLKEEEILEDWIAIQKC